MAVERTGDRGRGPTYDVFLSHSGIDTREVATLAAALRARGLSPWLDVEQLVPGAPFQSAIMTALSRSRCFAVFVGAEPVGTWVREELDAAIARATGDRSFRVFLVLLPTAPPQFDPTGLHQFLSQRTWVDLRGLDDPERAAELVARAVRGEPLASVHHVAEGTGPVCPYVGLRPFDVEDAKWFFGRDADVQRMAEKLRLSPFLAVLGRSGSGKSSVVRAGLIAALQAGRLIAGSEQWTVRLLRPTAAPLEALAAQLSVLRPDLPSSQVLDDLLSSDVALKVLLAGRGDRRPVIFVVDQAEELYTLCDSVTQRQAFTANLMHASQPGGPARVVLTLRSDFYARFMELEAFSARIASNQHVVTDLGDQELEQVIHQPATLTGLTLQPGLVERMLSDVRAQAGALPLLQHALRELWERRHDRQLTHEAYTQIGGVEGALAHRADEVFTDLDRAGDGHIVRRLMLELTRVEEGSEDTKQPVVLSQLEAPAFPLERLHRVTAALADARLVTTGTDEHRGRDRSDNTGQDQAGCGGRGSGQTAGPAPVTKVELAHEALIRSWPRLRTWIEASRDDLRARRRIRDAARAWDDQGRPDGLLYRDTPLMLARERFRRQITEMTRIETEFLTASIHREDGDRARTRRARRLALTSVVATLCLVAAATSALYITARRAQQTAEANAARSLAQQARALAPSKPALAVAVAAEALAMDESPEVASALQVAHLAYGEMPGRYRRVLNGHQAPVVAAAFNPDGTLLATGSDDGNVKLWDPHTGAEVRELPAHGGVVRSVTFSPDGRLLATASDDHTAMIWDPSTGRPLRPLVGHTTHVYDVAFSPDGRLVATAGGEGRVRIWEPDTGRHLRNFGAHDLGGVLAVDFSSDGRVLATTSRDGTVKLWDANTNDATDDTPMRVFTGHTGWVNDVAFRPGRPQLATVGEDKTVRIWDLRTGEIRRFSGHRDSVWSVAFNSDGTLLATSGRDATTKLWNPDTGAESTLTGHELPVLDVAFNPRDGLLATTSDDRSIKLWDTKADNEVRRLTGHTNAVVDVAFAPDGAHVATASQDDTVSIWTSDPGHAPTVIRHADTFGVPVFGVTFSPDGSRLVTVGEDETAQVRDAHTGNLLVPFGEHSGGVRAADFSPDGHLVATASDDGTAMLWDPETGDLVRTFDGHEGNSLTSVAFSPDGVWLATSSLDGTAQIWDVESGRSITRLVGHTSSVLDVTFSEDGSVVATAGMDRTARLWDTDTGDEITVLTNHEGAVREVAFSPDGSLLATASDDVTTKLWDVDSGDEITTLPGHDGEVFAVEFNDDGTRLATASRDQTALIRHLVLSPEDACALVAGEVAFGELQNALGRMTPRACTNLRPTGTADQPSRPNTSGT